MADDQTQIRFLMALLIAQSLLHLRLKGQRDCRERENKRTDGWPGPASAGKCRRPGRRTLHKQRSSSVLRGANLGTIWGKGVNYSSK